MILSRFFLSLMVITQLAASITTVPAQWSKVRKDPDPLLGIGGMALLEQREATISFIVVHDNRLGGPRAGILTVVEGKQPDHLELSWPKYKDPEDKAKASRDPAYKEEAKLPSDLEAITLVPGPPLPTKTFICVESTGNAFHISVDPESKALRVLKEFKLPAPAANIEAFALHLIDGKLLAMWADRGWGKQPATLFWRRFDLATYEFVGGVKEKAVTVDYPENTCVRHISDLKVDSGGKVYISAARDCDTNDDGPFESAAYYIGSFKPGKDQFEFNLLPDKDRLELLKSQLQKIEALELVPGPKAGFIFGSDDENHGSSIYFKW